MAVARLRTRTVGVALAGALATIAVLGPTSASAQEPSSGVSFALSPSTTQAGAHPDLTTRFALKDGGGLVEQMKDIQIGLPTGLVGNPRATPQCSADEFELVSCQPSAQVGVLELQSSLEAPAESEEGVPHPIPVYNLTPTPDHLATLGVSILLARVVIEIDIEAGGLVVRVHDLTTLLPITGAKLTLWGVPASHVHDLERSRTELGGPQPIYGPPGESGERKIIGFEPTPAGVAPAAFLTNPTDCAGPALTSTIAVDSWENPEMQLTSSSPFPQPSGCQLLHLSPSLSVVPDTTQRDVPAGYEIDLGYPLNEDPYGLATPDLRELAVTLPSGTSLSPGVTNGLVGCSQEQFDANACPRASQVGTVAVSTPLLSEQLTGTVNIAAPTPSAMFGLLVGAAAAHVSIHLTGVVALNAQTGQVTVSFAEVPQLPFSELRFHLFGGPGAVLANPLACGPAVTHAELSPYSATEGDEQQAALSSSFTVDANGAGAACPAATPFHPSLSAGTISPLAGGFAPFTFTVSGDEGQQPLSTIAAQLPPGLLGMLAQVPLCEEPRAATGACAAAALIGSVTVDAGTGAEPLYLSGQVYLTGPYRGAPFGLSIVIPALAGPFDLGTVVVRAQVQVNAVDLHLTIVSDPLPQILAGIPLRLRTLSLTLNRDDFIFNPTSCSPLALTATVESAEEAQAAVSTPFQVHECATLAFAPRLTASTHASPLNSHGAPAGLEVKIAMPKPGGANIRSVSVTLPGRLRPRLSALQHACPASTLAADPGGCPRGSRVGSATVATPVLAAPLTGSVYVVALGHREFPELAMLLHGDRVAVQLDGTLRVGGSGSPTAVFPSLPDVPIRSFAIDLAQGANAILGTTGSLCARPIRIPYTIVGHNGARIKSSERVAVNGCARRRARPR